MQVLRNNARAPSLPIIDGAGEATAIVWPGVGAHLRSIHRISLSAGSRTTRLQHPMEAVYYVMNGNATASDQNSSRTAQLVTGSMVLVDPGTPYIFVAGDGGVELVGGPCPADPAMYRHLEEEAIE